MTDEAFVTFADLVEATGITPATIRQWLWRQWHRSPRTRIEWAIATATDLTTRQLVYSLPDAMRTEAATRRSAMRRDSRPIA